MIRWILNNLGTAAFDAAALEPGIHVVDVRELVDREGNPVSVIRDKIQIACRYMDEGKKVVICCDHGISRSNSIAAGVIAAKGMSFREAVQTVLNKTGEKFIKIGVLDKVRRALEVQDGLHGNSILVLGGQGHLGQGLVSALCQAKKEYLAPASKDLDAMDASGLSLAIWETGASTLVHLAKPAVSTTAKSLGKMLAMLKSVLDVCVATGIRLVMPISWEIYSGYCGRVAADENLAPKPDGTRGEAAMLCEALIKHYQQDKGLLATMLCLSMVYGPSSSRPPFIHNFIAKAKQNLPIVTHSYRNGFPALDLLHETDAAQALFLAATNPDISGKFNIGTGRLSTTGHIAEMIVEYTDSKSVISHIDLDVETALIAMNSQKAERILGWTPKIILEDGLAGLLGRKRNKYYD